MRSRAWGLSARGQPRREIDPGAQLPHAYALMPTKIERPQELRLRAIGHELWRRGGEVALHAQLHRHMNARAVRTVLQRFEQCHYRGGSQEVFGTLMHVSSLAAVTFDI